MSEREAWRDSPAAVKEGVYMDLWSMIDALPHAVFPMTKKELHALLAGWRNHKGSM